MVVVRSFGLALALAHGEAALKVRFYCAALLYVLQVYGVPVRCRAQVLLHAVPKDRLIAPAAAAAAAVVACFDRRLLVWRIV